MSDRKEFIADLAEQLRYLRELGVESIEADLPDRLPHAEPEVPHSEFQTYVPSEGELRSPDRPLSDHFTSTSPARKKDILGSLRISDMTKRDEVPAQTVRKEESGSPARPADPDPVPSPEPGLFGDSPGLLPESDERLEDIHNDIGRDCARCRLCEKRTQVVNSVGNPSADLMFIGEAPGADEDLQGEPFVGRAGQLLTKIIEAIDLKREEVFIGNINRCRPPDNRRPQADEAEVCKPFLLREIAVVRPKVIVVLGNTACQNLLDTKVGITRLRGKFLDFHGIRVMPTFHPAYLLRDPRKKREVWEDMKLVRTAMSESGREEEFNGN